MNDTFIFKLKPLLFFICWLFSSAVAAQPFNYVMPNLSQLGLKGRVNSITTYGPCSNENLSSLMSVDTATCKEVYHFTESGAASYYASYNKLGVCIARAYAEYAFHDLISDFIIIEFGDTVHYKAIYDLLGRMLSFAWEKNHREYERANYSYSEDRRHIDIEYYEKGELTKKIEQTLNEYDFLTKEHIKELITRKTINRIIEYRDSLVISDTGLEQEYFNNYDDQNRLIYSRAESEYEYVEVFYKYNERGQLAEMTTKEKGKLSEKYTFEYNENGLPVAVKLFFDDYELISDQLTFYDEYNRIVKEVEHENIGAYSEKTTTREYVYDHEDNWIEMSHTVEMMGTKIPMKYRREIVYY